MRCLRGCLFSIQGSNLQVVLVRLLSLFLQAGSNSRYCMLSTSTCFRQSEPCPLPNLLKRMNALTHTDV